MSKNKTLFLIGFLLIVLPFVGLTNKWEDIFTVLFGVLVLIITYVSVRRSRLLEKEKEVISYKKQSFYNPESGAVLSSEEFTDDLVLSNEQKY